MKDRLLIPTLALAAVLLAGAGLTAFAIDGPPTAAVQGPAGEVVDAALNERVEATLKTDAGLAGTRLAVSTQAGIVTLAGVVPDENALRRALETASKVKGVREVRSTIAIEPPK